MTNERVLITLVHISDLHVGQIDAEGRVTVPDAIVRQWWGVHRAFGGLLGHTFKAMAQLEEFVSDLGVAERTCLIVTGDLTTCGRLEEFELARQFLEGEAEFLEGSRLGLCAADVSARWIPGNHDHWPGRPIVFGPPGEHFSRFFPKRPLEPQIIGLDEHRRLIVLGINTDEDVHHYGSCRLYGRGSFVSQLEALEQQLESIDSQDGDIRVLLMHHSRMHAARTLGITDESRNRLEATIKRGRLAALLSGHLHGPAVHVERVSDERHTWDLVEARCGTTLQLDEIPKKWRDRGSGDVRLEPNNLLLHRLVDIGGSRIEWRTTSISRTNRGGFENVVPLPGARPVTVWERS